MPMSFYMDVHVPQPITDQLRRRAVDVISAIDDGFAERDDHELLERARELGRLIFTQDIGFKALAENWQRQGQHFAGLLFGHQLGGALGQYVKDLELIAKASEPGECNVVEYLPF